MGTSGSQRRGFRRTRAGAGGVPAVGGRGGVLVPQVARSAVSALRGWSGEPQKSVEIRWIGIGVVRGWSPPRTGQVCERISAQTPWIHPESKSGSEIALNARSSSACTTASNALSFIDPFRYPLGYRDVPQGRTRNFLGCKHLSFRRDCGSSRGYERPRHRRRGQNLWEARLGCGFHEGARSSQHSNQRARRR